MYKEQNVKRREDQRLVSGQGRYTGDMRPEKTLHLVFVRSPHAHARITSIGVEDAARAEGVVSVLTATDLEAAGLTESPGGFPVKRHDGSDAPKTPRPSLARDVVRHVGEPVAAVVAETLAAATDAAELVDVEYDTLPAVTAANARAEGATAVWGVAPDNIAFRWQGGDESATDAAFASAAHVTRQTLSISRVATNSMEPRNCLVIPQENDHLLIHASHQSPFTLRSALEACGFEKGTITVQVGDVGGSFGLKMGVVIEAIPIAHAARLTGRPVLWESTRSESFQSDDHSRELIANLAVAFDAGNRITGLKASVDANLGAYLSTKSIWTMGNIGGIAGVYDIPAIHAEVWGVFTNTVQTAAYRGAGRPEATYMIERLLDIAANELDISPLELRRINLISPDKMPYKTALTFEYDCGDFEAGMHLACQLAHVDMFEEREDDARRRGKLRGLGISNSIEVAGGPFAVYAPDIARVSLMQDGRLRVQSGSMSVGQGFETVYPQLIADSFGIDAGNVIYQQGDTDILPWGRGNGGSSALCVGGSAVTKAAGTLGLRMRELAAEYLNAPLDAITLEDGLLKNAEGNTSMTLAELASKLDPESEGVTLSSVEEFKPEGATFPNGTHICEVEIDPLTGTLEIVNYTAVEDIGTVINPMTAEGQVQGGVVQGIGQAIGEEVGYDEGGQILTGSFMDYQMPRAQDLPSFTLGFNPVPTKVNPLGAKGVGEAGTVGALSATMNAVNAALAQAGVRNLDMPATPARIWRALQEAR